MKTIEELYNEWQELQPLSPENQKRLDQKFMLEFNYNSNHLEGNTLTYGQTKLLLMFGETSGDARLRDYEEMKAHNVGLELVKREALDKERPLTESFIRELNRTILVEDFYKIQKSELGISRHKIHVGVYKTHPNSVITATGEIFDYASPEETPALMTDLIKWYNAEQAKAKLTSIQLAALLHYRFIRIHPFEDGNGRIARLLVNYVLARHSYPMIIVQSKDKDNYLNTLHKCDVEVGLVPSKGANAMLEHIGPFVAYIKKLAEYALTIAIRAGKGESIEEDDDFAKRITILERDAKQKNHLELQIIKAKSDKVRDVINLFYIPLRKKIVVSLKSASQTFYEQERDETYFSKNKEKEDALKINKTEEWIKDPIDSQKISLLSEIKSVFYTYFLRYPKKEYKMLPTILNLDFKIIFEEEYYLISCLNNKEFKYGTYPSEVEIEQIVSMYKAKILEKIEKAIHG